MYRISQSISKTLVALMLLGSLPISDPSFANSEIMRSYEKGRIEQQTFKEKIAAIHLAAELELLVDIKEGQEQAFSLEIMKIFGSAVSIENKVGQYTVLKVNNDKTLTKLKKHLAKQTLTTSIQPNYALNAYGVETQGAGINGNNSTTVSSTTFKPTELTAKKVELPPEQPTTPYQNVLVGVLDSGIDPTNETLSNSLYTNPFEVPNNGIDDDGNGFIDDVHGWDFFNNDHTTNDPLADETHGTQVASVILKNEYTTAPNVTIVPLKFMNGKEGYTSDAIEAIEYAKKLGVKILNLSFGCDENNIALKKAIEDSGMLVVTAAGNDAKNLDDSPVYPASYDLENIVTVGSLATAGSNAYYSNYGKAIDLVVPGTFNRVHTVNSKSVSVQGTSYASGLVTGEAARLLGENSQLSTMELRKNLINQLKVQRFTAAQDMLPNTSFFVSDTTREGRKLTQSVPVMIDSKVKPFGVNLSPQMIDAIHFGENGVSASTGNYSLSQTDLSVNAPGFAINFSRTYNSKDDRTVQSMGRGWTFGFEGSIKPDTTNPTVYIAKLPNSKIQIFEKTGPDTFVTYDSRSQLKSTGANNYELTTSDQYKYEYTNGLLTAMVDRSGNRVTIEHQDASGRVKRIIDSAKRVYTLEYVNDRISKILLPENREIAYTYINGNLVEVKNLAGQVRGYTYDDKYRVTSVIDSDKNVLETIEYEAGDSNKVSKLNEITGRVTTFRYGDKTKPLPDKSFALTDNFTVLSDNFGRSYVKFFDNEKYVTDTTMYFYETVIAKTSTTYYSDKDGKNRYGDVKTSKDMYGNVTEYIRDENGNVIKTINPDKSFKSYVYDGNYNLIEETNEDGKKKYYIYDETEKLLLKEVRPLDGVSPYNDSSDRSKFEIVEYKYFNEVEKLKLGIEINGLVKEKIDANGNVYRFSYDSQGNKTRIVSPEGHATEYVYNGVAWPVKEIRPDGSVKEIAYDAAGRVIRTTVSKGTDSKTERTVYDLEGRPTLMIDANAYRAEHDASLNSKATGYSLTDGATQMSYTNNGTLKDLTTPDGAKTSYEYDIYGNLMKKTLPNGSIYTFRYDPLNRMILKNFYNSAADVVANKIIPLEEITYLPMTPELTKSGLHAKKVKTYFAQEAYKDAFGKPENTALFNEVTLYENYYDKTVKVKRMDGVDAINVYTKSGNLQSETDFNGASKYYTYDGLGRVSEIWSPIEDGLYTYTQKKYDPNSNVVEEIQSVDLVRLHYKTPEDRCVTVKQSYNKNNLVKRKEVVGGVITEYKYDVMGRVIGEYVTADDKTVRKVTFEYTAFGEIAKKNNYADSKELKVDTLTASGEVTLSEKYAYDKNSNLKTVIFPDGRKTTNEYDNMNRLVKMSMSLTNELGKQVLVSATTAYDKMGNVIETKDYSGKVVKFAYNAMGQKIADMQTVTQNSTGTPVTVPVVNLYKFDLTGKLIASIAPKHVNYNGFNFAAVENYDFNQSVRTEHRYDTYGNRFLSKEVYREGIENTPKELVTYVATHDKNGNVTKEISGEAWRRAAGTDFDIKVKNAYGKNYTYTRSNQLKSVGSPEAQKQNRAFVVEYSYDGLNRKTEEADYLGQVNTYYYDANSKITAVGKRKSVHEPEVILQKNTYNKVGDIIETADALGNVTKYVYGKSGKVSSQISPFKTDKEKYAQNFYYNLNGIAVAITDTTGKEISVEVNENGQELKRTITGADKKQSLTEQSGYYLTGQKAFSIAPNGNVSKWQYNELGQMTSLSQAASAEKAPITIGTFTYDLNGNKLTEKDRFGNTFTLTYDVFNRLIEKKDAKGKVIESLTYDNDHKQILSKDALENGVLYKYDLDGKLVSQSNRIPKLSVEKALASITALKDPKAPNVPDPVEATLKWKNSVYDLKGRLLENVDQLGNSTEFKYDELDRIIEVKNALGELTSYSYDLNGNLISQTNGNGHTTLMEYNAKNQLVRRIDPNGRSSKDGEYVYNPALTVSLTYNPNGTLATTKDRNGNLFKYEYDAFDRCTKTASGTDFMSKAYDANGNTTKVSTNSSDVVRAFDFLGRVTQKTVSKVGTASFTYDVTTTVAAGENKEITIDPLGNTFEKVFDQNGRLKEVIDQGDKTVYNYTDNGARQSVVYPGGVSETYTYNEDYTVKTLTNTVGSNTLDTYSYTYDAAGNKLSKTDAKGTTYYTYDELNRLKTVKEPSGKEVEYEYDGAGNRIRECISEKDSIVVKKYAYNSQNRLLDITVTDLTTSREEKQKFVYDNNGNQLYTLNEVLQKGAVNAKPSFGMYISGQSYVGESARVFFESNMHHSYDVWNQLVSTKVADVEVSYKYNGEGQRIEKSTVKKGVKKTIRYVRLGADIALELDENGKVLSKNVSGTSAISREVDGVKYFMLYNGEGDVTALVDRNGAVKERYYYDAFGNVKESLDASNQPMKAGESKSNLKYRGYEYDEETKLYYLNARMYDPATARFLQEDTYRGQLNDPLSLNLYTYCHNEPMNYYDPSGHTNLKIGSKGNEVKDLQKELIEAGYKITADGVFGKQTETALKDFQKKNGLTADGIAGKNTNAKLEANHGSTTTKTPQVTQKLENTKSQVTTPKTTSNESQNNNKNNNTKAVNKTNPKSSGSGASSNELKPQSNSSNNDKNSNNIENITNNTTNKNTVEAPKGSTGNEQVDYYLKTMGFDITKVDGNMGVDSSSSLIIFQYSQHIPVTGIADPETLAKLKECANQKVTYDSIMKSDVIANWKPETVVKPFDAKNGKLDTDDFAHVATKGSVDAILPEPVAVAWALMVDDASKVKGLNMDVFELAGPASGYRSFDQQKQLKIDKGDLAATPGKSNHGFGLAMDLCPSITGQKRAGVGVTAEMKWLEENASKYGFAPLLDKETPKKGGKNFYFETWHWNYYSIIKDKK